MEDKSSVLATTLSSDPSHGQLSCKGDKTCQPPHISIDVSARQLSPPDDSAGHLYEFHYFAKLPAEVRSKIWNLAFSLSSPRIYIPFSVGSQNDFLVLDLDKENDVDWLLALRDRFPKCDIPWDVIENDFCRERNLDWQLGVLNDWGTGVEEFEGQYHIRLGDADSKDVRHLSLPTDVQVDVLDIVNDTWVDPDGISDSLHGYFWFMMPWVDYATLVSQIWASSIGVATFPETPEAVLYYTQYQPTISSWGTYVCVYMNKPVK
ncbi:hypothetical protein NOF04DRAFT_18149 [Fusarium oxysporum II5]|uniref:2EXR domain-containing protein n=1 Tax=Fusarium odoratissimum (strain NRRL 54006) TaxID=1089451 RepID=X0K252_FUSO5|nr:uncharacterized protein FOIG_15642 [Fusarium odoratissimum NRRL 54006]EXL91144.1 hypothetical protein FOIG_15642 [Fusarium odoratissimum NRRL 54006]KAK2129016.1 hypothetical protein NOF04DRAFT_18149 [Fusarium oxysporum II5]